jgi:hypothetical protein
MIITKRETSNEPSDVGQQISDTSKKGPVAKLGTFKGALLRLGEILTSSFYGGCFTSSKSPQPIMHMNQTPGNHKKTL